MHVATALNLAAENLNDLLQDSRISIEIPENGCNGIEYDRNGTDKYSRA